MSTPLGYTLSITFSNFFFCGWGGILRIMGLKKIVPTPPTPNTKEKAAAAPDAAAWAMEREKWLGREYKYGVVRHCLEVAVFVLISVSGFA